LFINGEEINRVSNMASKEQVKQYLAYWFQLGKKVIMSKSEKTFLPSRVFEGDRYSSEFETCWQEITASNKDDCYLQGTSQTIQQLLSSAWSITSCARCAMPIPMIDLGFSNPDCPCSDLDNWPNSELPPPRSPINNQKRLNQLRQRLGEKANVSESTSHKDSEESHKLENHKPV